MQIFLKSVEKEIKMLSDNVYAKAWKLFSRKIEKKPVWGRVELKGLMVERFNDAADVPTTKGEYIPQTIAEADNSIKKIEESDK
jgi:hypothetical protein